MLFSQICILNVLARSTRVCLRYRHEMIPSQLPHIHNTCFLHRLQLTSLQVLLRQVRTGSTSMPTSKMIAKSHEGQCSSPSMFAAAMSSACTILCQRSYVRSSRQRFSSLDGNGILQPDVSMHRMSFMTVISNCVRPVYERRPHSPVGEYQLHSLPVP